MSISVQDYGYGLETGFLSSLIPGVYISARSNFRKPSSGELLEQIDYNIAKNILNHEEKDNITRSVELTAGLNYPITNSLYILCGVTWIRTEKFTKFFDKTYYYSYDGTYYAKGVQKEIFRPNLSVGYLVEDNFIVRAGTSFDATSFLEAAVCFVF